MQQRSLRILGHQAEGSVAGYNLKPDPTREGREGQGTEYASVPLTAEA